MIKRMYILIFVLSSIVTWNEVNAQNESFKSPVITDEMTVNPDQNREWRAGQSKYSAKPKNMWELGINVGRFAISGDVPTTAFPGWGAGLHLRKAINYALSIRLDGAYMTTKGFDDRLSYGSVMALEQLPDYGSVTNDMYRNYKNTTLSGSVEAIFNIGNILFHKERNKWNFYVGVGVGAISRDTRVNNSANGVPINWNALNLNKDDKYSDNVKKIKDAMDSEYEIKVGNKRDVSPLFNDGNVSVTIPLSVGISRKINKRVNLSLEHKYYWVDNDTWDGFVNRSVYDQTNSRDAGQYTSLRLGINLGKFDKRTEPLYWMNPLDGALNDVAELKQRPKFDLTDSDGDGVIDMIDQEKNSPQGAPVDTRGITLDSDKDGIPDYKDDEPFSPPGYEVDSKGVAVITDKPVTESRLAEALKATKNDWWLPMIHFDTDKYYVKPEFYAQLKSVADVMKANPNVKITVNGYTDARAGDDYNKVLSYNRAKAAIDFLVGTYNIPRERFILQYEGKSDPVIPGLPASHNITKQAERQQYMNRRVEFKVATSEDVEMAQPTGPKAGANTPGSSRKGSKYSGNANSGY